MIPGGSTRLPAASNSAPGAVTITGGIADATNPKARSADDFQVKALAAAVGPIASQTTLQPITGLGLSITASTTEVWLAKYWLSVSAANTAMDIKFGFTYPSGCTIVWGCLPGSISALAGWGAVSTAVTPVALKTEADTLSLGTGAIVALGLPLIAIVTGGGTAGTVQLQYAQNTSDAGNLSINLSSCLEATRGLA